MIDWNSRKIPGFLEFYKRHFVERLLLILLYEMADTRRVRNGSEISSFKRGHRKQQNHVCTFPGLFKLRRVVTKYEEEGDRIIRLESCCQEPDSARTSFKIRCVPAVNLYEARAYLSKYIDLFELC